jgi:hypothetical protein
MTGSTARNWISLSALVKPGDTVSVDGGMHAYLKERQPSLGIVPAWLQTDYGLVSPTGVVTALRCTQ